MGKSKTEPHGRRYDVRWLATEFKIDRMRLARRCDELGIDKSKGITLSQAYDAITYRLDIEKERLLRQRANREASEAISAEKRGLIRKEYERRTADYALKTKNVIAGAPYLSPSQKKRLSLEIADIEPPVA